MRRSVHCTTLGGARLSVIYATHLFDARLTSCLVPKASIDSTKYFCKHNFRNDHAVTKITKIFYYENLEPYGIRDGVANVNISVLGCLK